jgi:5-methylcytosine-specific restriction endonuclease McrA
MKAAADAAHAEWLGRRSASPVACAEPDCPKVGSKRGYCGAHYQKRCRPNRDHGGEESKARWRQNHPEQYAKHLEDKNHRRRARARLATAEKIDRQKVGERDGWRCFCGKKIDPILKSPHPMSQSLDHIVPISDGGDHTYANVRIAHRLCNTRRGNRGGTEQLALIG